MTFFPVYLFLFLCAGVAGLLWVRAKAQRRSGSLKLRHYAFPPGWLEYLERNLPAYWQIPMDLRPELQDSIIHFIDSRKWRACGGLPVVTDEMKVTIAANACLLVLNRRGEMNFNRVLSVLIYPAPAGASGRTSPAETPPSGAVAVEWDEAAKTVRDWRHPAPRAPQEMAERLGLEKEQDGGTAAGRHFLWGRILGQDLTRSAAGHAETPGSETAMKLLEMSAPQDPAEFFAAATDLFFRKPDRLPAQCPELHRLLVSFYQMDPSRWKPAR